MIDNDAVPSAQATVEATASAAPFPVRYLHAPQNNISLARNAALDAANGDLIAFFDDDQIAEPTWIARLLHRLDETGTDGVFGCVCARYPETAAPWMREQDFHSSTPIRRNGGVQTGSAGNSLLRWKETRWTGERYDLARGVSGGEDTEFFFRLRRLGATYELASEARVWEPVEPSRLSYFWLQRRRFRSGQSYASIATNRTERVKLFGTAGAKAVYCYLRGGLQRDPGARAFWLLRGAVHAGVCTGCLGAKGIPIYKA